MRGVGVQRKPPCHPIVNFISFFFFLKASPRNILGEHLVPQTMEWTGEDITERFLNLEQNEDFVSFKSNDEAYLTFTKENKLTFKKDSAPEENQKFLLDEQCIPSNPFKMCF